MLVALLIAAADPGLMAVLEFKNKLKGEDVDSGFLADEVRSAALKALPGLRVMTHENMQVLLAASGKKLDECEGECEVDTGRRIGADLVVSGELLKFGTSYKLDLKMHATADGRLLAGAIASGKTIDELDAATGPAVRELLAPLTPAPAPVAKQAAPSVAPSTNAQPVPQKTSPVAVAHLESRTAKTGIQLVHLPAGVAHLGCSAGDNDCSPQEKPQHTAHLEGFWIARTEVSAGQYSQCIRDKACTDAATKRLLNRNCNLPRRRFTHPMNCVTYEEALAFCKYIGGRLPIAAEWEYAAKSGGDSIYPWGNEPVDGTRANFCDKNCMPVLKRIAQARAELSIDDGYAATAPVGSYPHGASKWGLLDMAGNVTEWTASDYDGEKELRGGNWARPSVDLRTTHRYHSAASRQDAAVGFRCAQ